MSEPNPNPPRVLPASVQLNLLTLLCTYLLYERSQETELRTMVEGMITERHRNFHSEETTWQDCRNQICVNAGLLLKAAREQEVVMNQFSIQLMAKYVVSFNPLGTREGGLQSLRARLVERAAVAPATEAAPPAGRIIMP